MHRGFPSSRPAALGRRARLPEAGAWALSAGFFGRFRANFNNISRELRKKALYKCPEGWYNYLADGAPVFRAAALIV